jgi:hypothetical protein
MIFETASTAVPIPYTAVLAGQVNAALVAPVPPPGSGWYPYTWGMFDRSFTCVPVNGLACLGWLWQRRIA